MNIRPLNQGERLPMELFFLADPDEQVVQSYVTRCQCFIMEQDEQCIGTYLLLPTRPHTVELVNIAIAESMQGKGLGGKLTRHAIETSKSMGYKTIEVGTGNSSLMQLHLYQKCGFRITGVDMDFFVRHYKEPIYENGIQCRDMIRLQQDL
jgi:ribosomal protein S18 acetylase RimI-like enzyme